MRRIAIAVACVIAITLAAQPATAAFETGCCACVDVEEATTSQAPPPEPIPAIFCSMVVGEGYPAFVQQCMGAGGSNAPCVDPAPGQSCAQALEVQEGIVCPVGPGAPAAGAPGLAALAALLGGLGVAVLRRRSRA